MKKLSIVLVLMFMLVAGAAAGEVYTEKVSYKKTSDVYVKDAKFLGGLSIMDCQNMIFENCEIVGLLSLNDSYPEVGLSDLLFLNCDIHDATTDRLVMLGATTASNITFQFCTFRRCIHGTHIVYMSGGHWNADWPPITNIVFMDCLFELNPASRHNLQFNGRFDGVKILRCIFRHAQLNGISLIGVQNALIKDCLFYGHNKGWGIVIYDYASHWAHKFNNFQTQEDIDAFRATHWPCQNITIERNTIVVGPKQFSVDPWHWDDPSNRAGVMINNAVHSGFHIYVPDPEKGIILPPVPEGDFITPEPDYDGNDWGPAPAGDDYIYVQFDYPNDNLIIRDNIIYNFNKIMLDFEHPYEATQTMFDGNMVYCPPGGKQPPWIRHYGYLESCLDNFYMDPDFNGKGNYYKWPKYGFVDLGADPDYDWTQFETFFDPYSKPGEELEKGMTVKPPESPIKEHGKEVEKEPLQKGK